MSICLLSVVITSVYQWQGEFEPVLFLFISENLPPAANFEEIRHGQLWRLFTPALLHLYWFHLIVNVVLFWQVAGLLERTYGSLVLGGLLVALVLPSNLGQYLYAGPEFGGLSGVIFGLFAFIWIYGLVDKRASVYLPAPLAMFLMVLYAAGWIPQLGQFANMQHTGGLLSGILIGLFTGLYTRL